MDTSRLDQLLTAQGDGSGTFDFNTAAVTITAATTASPVVCTAASHPFSDGDWLWIVGATGITEINGLRRVTAAATDTFQLTDEDDQLIGSAGTFGGTCTARICLVIQPAATKIIELKRMNLIAADGSAIVVDGMIGEARLANGIYASVFDSSGLVQHLTPKPVQGWNEWNLAAGADATVSDLGTDKLEAACRWTFYKSGPNILLSGPAKERLVIYSQDALDGLSAFRAAVQGQDRTL